MQRLTTSHARRCLTWCLVALLPCLGLGIAQRQTLGPLHVHAASVAAAVQPGADLLREALAWWWAQVQAQTDARQHARQHARAHPHEQAHKQAHEQAYEQAHKQAHGQAGEPSRGHSPEHAHGHAKAAVHAHDAWQRHHHGDDDAGLIALDAPGDGHGSPGAGALLLLPVLGSPQDGLRIDAGAALMRAWPRAGDARFSSWGRAPPLQPPRG